CEPVVLRAPRNGLADETHTSVVGDGLARRCGRRGFILGLPPPQRDLDSKVPGRGPISTAKVLEECDEHRKDCERRRPCSGPVTRLCQSFRENEHNAGHWLGGCSLIATSYSHTATSIRRLHGLSPGGSGRVPYGQSYTGSGSSVFASSWSRHGQLLARCFYPVGWSMVSCDCNQWIHIQPGLDVLSRIFPTVSAGQPRDQPRVGPSDGSGLASCVAHVLLCLPGSV